jgi:hypothetical protein
VAVAAIAAAEVARKVKKGVIMKDRATQIAIYVADFEDFFLKYEGLVSSSILINEFTSKCPLALQKELHPLFKESVWLRNTLSFRPMPEEMSKRVWARIKKKIRD